LVLAVGAGPTTVVLVVVIILALLIMLTDYVFGLLFTQVFKLY
jgi:preprotein translocase SecE subunit